MLAEELGIDPSPELQRLHQAILVQDPALEAAAPDRGQPRHNLPERLTSLVGRERGAAGGGQAGGAAPAGDGDRAGRGGQDQPWPWSWPGGWRAAIRTGCGWSSWPPRATRPCWPRSWPRPWGCARRPASRSTAPAPADRLAGFVRDKALLLVLDNCEHLVGACAELVRRLLRAGPGLRVLATSREVAGRAPARRSGRSRRWPSPTPMTSRAAPRPTRGDRAGGAGRLRRGAAVRRAGGRRRPRLRPRPRTTRRWWPSCAGGWTGCRWRSSWPRPGCGCCPSAELAARLGDRFRLLAGGGRTVDARQQTLRAAVDWSWELLDEPERRAVAAAGGVRRRLDGGGGRGGLRRRRAGAGGRCWTGCSRLVDRSLVVAVPAGAPARFRLLETLRDYGAERLAEAGETGALAARHTAWFLDLAERAAAHRTARRWLRLLARRLRQPAGGAGPGGGRARPDTALRLAGALGWYWWTARTIEGRQRLAGVLALADGQPPTPQLARASRRRRCSRCR